MNRIGQPTVTQQMVATKAKLHASTVSLALRNDLRLSLATRRRVQRIAHEMGYTTNPLLALLMSRVRRKNVNYRGTLAYIHSTSIGTSGLPVQALSGARDRATELGYCLDEFHCNPSADDYDNLKKTLHARNIVGLIFEPSPCDSAPGASAAMSLDFSNYPVATLGSPLLDPLLNHAASDPYTQVIIATREALKLGYSRPGLVLALDGDTSMAHHCASGYRALQDQAQLPLLPICSVAPQDRSALSWWIDRHCPDVVFSPHLETLAMLRATGRSVPAEIGWAHLAWNQASGQVAGVGCNHKKIGATAVDLVISQLHRGETGPPLTPITCLIAGEWNPGETVRPLGPPDQLGSAVPAA